MPFEDGSYTTYGSDEDRTAGNDVRANQAVAQQMQHETYNPLTQILGYTIGGVVDLGDTIGSSVSAVLPGSFMERGDLNQAALSFAGSPGLNKWYEQNKSGLEATSGVEGIVASELLARRFTAPASAFMRGMRATPYLRRIALLDREAEGALQTVNALTKVGVSRGVSGTALARTEANVLLRGSAQDARGFGPFMGSRTRSTELWKAKGLSAAAGARDAAVTEAIMGLTLNQNGFLYDESAAYNMAFVGVGLGAGAGIQAFSTAYRARKFANSDLIRRETAAALDPAGIGEDRLSWFDRATGKGNGRLDAGDWLAGVRTDRISDLKLQSNSLRDKTDMKLLASDSPRELESARNALANQVDSEMTTELNLVTSKGISTNGQTRFNQTAPAYWNHTRQLLERDPMALQNAEMLGGIPDNVAPRDLVDAHWDRVEARAEEVESKILELEQKRAVKDLTPKQQKEYETAIDLGKRLRYEQGLTARISIDGEWMPLSEGDSIAGWIEPEISVINFGRKSPGVDLILGANPSGAKGAHVLLDNNLSLTLPGKKTLENADLFDVMRAYRLADEMMNRMQNAAEPFRINLPEKPSWFQLDMAEELQRRGANVEINYPGQMTRETAQTEAFIQKSAALKRAGALDSKALEKGQTYTSKLSAARIRYNLPKLTAYERGVTGREESGVEMLLRGMGDYTPEELRALSPEQLREGVAQFKRIGDAVDATPHDLASLYGNSFRFMKGEDGKPIKPLIGFFRDFHPDKWSADHLAERLANAKQRRLSVLTANPEAALTKTIAETTTNSADLGLVARPDQLNDLQLQGSVFGSMPGTGPGALSRVPKTSEHTARDNPTLLAAIRLRDQVARITRGAMRTVIETSFGDSLKILNNGRNEASKLLLNQFHSYRSGWDLNAAAVKTEDGFNAFRLGNTAENHERYRIAFDRDMPVDKDGNGPLLTTLDGRLIVLDDLALQVQQNFNKVSSHLITEKNQLLASLGRNQINQQNHFTPSPNVQGKHVGFVLGPNGKVVPGYTIVEDTERGFDLARESLFKRMEELPGGGMGYQFRTQEDIQNFTEIWDRVDMEMFDPNITAIQPGKKAKGALVGREVKLDAFENSLRYLQDQFLSHGDDVFQSILKEQINAAKARSRITGNVVRDSSGKPDKYRNVHDYYLENLLGRDKLSNPASLVGGVLKGAEKAIDKVLGGASVNASVVWTQANRFIRDRWSNFTGKETEQGVKDFKALSTALGPYMPFESAAEMTARKYAGVDPLTTSKITSGMNQFAAAMMLRILEVGQPIMNMAGIVNAMPSVIRHMQPGSAESAADYAARIGHAAHIFNLTDGRQIGVVDMGKIAKRSLERAWNRSSHADYDFMMQRGYLSQEVAEFQKQFGAIQTPSEWRQMTKKVVDWTSTLSDRSEDLSRSWGHMIGLEMADLLKIEGRETRHAFAHDMANKMIANYNPANRPEVFQGALGAPLGLFQSFVQNFYQRMFRYIETKDARAFATQQATQGALFGMTGLAGYKEVMGTLGGLSENDEHPAGGFLGHGLLGQIPALVGGDAVDFASRGDTSVRIPGVGTQQLPGMAVASKLYEGVTAAASLFAQDNANLTPTQVAEILSNTLANRPISGLIEQFGAGGLDTDAYGQVVTETRGWMEAVYRGLGLRSQRQAEELNAYYADKNAMEHKASLDDKLRQQTRAAMRAGRFDKLPTVFEKYLANGGDAKHFKRWMKENYEAATTTRAERQLEKLLKNPAYFDRAQRMMDAGVDVTANETYSDDDLSAIMGQTNSLLTDYYDQQAQQGNNIPVDDYESPYGM